MAAAQRLGDLGPRAADDPVKSLAGNRHPGGAFLSIESLEVSEPQSLDLIGRKLDLV